MRSELLKIGAVGESKGVPLRARCWLSGMICVDLYAAIVAVLSERSEVRTAACALSTQNLNSTSFERHRRDEYTATTARARLTAAHVVLSERWCYMLGRNREWAAH